MGVDARGHTDDTHLGNVALQQRVGRLGGTVGDERYVFRRDLIFLHQRGNDLYYAVGYALAVGRGDLPLCQHLVGAGVNDHRIGKGPADVNADPYFFAHGLPPICR